MNWFELYRRGWIPGPRETAEQFLNRQSYASKVSLDDQAYVITEKIYGVKPDWIPMEISSKGLRFWEAGAAWQDEGGGWRIQIHPKRKFVAKKEIIAHEAVHAVRGAFQEKVFEEILAYRTSKTTWRKFFGPLFQTSAEAWVLLGSSMVDMVWSLLGGIPCATLLVVLFGLARLLRNQWRFSRAIERLPNACLVIGLTDREIVALAKGATFSSLNDGSIRWQMLNACGDALSEDASPVYT